MWLELAAKPVSLTVSENESPVLTASAVPDTALAFCAVIGKLIFAVADGVAVAVPPQAAMTRTLTRASSAFFTSR